MTSVDPVEALPAWQKALIAKKREERRKIEEMPSWKRELLNKKRISDGANYVNSNKESCHKSINISRTTNFDNLPLRATDATDSEQYSKCVNGHNKDVNMHYLGNDEVCRDTLHREGDSSLLSQNPFIRSFGLKLQRKHSSERIPIHENNFNGLRTDISYDDSFIGEYHPGSGYVHKLLDKFASLSSKNETSPHSDIQHDRLRPKQRSNSVDRCSASSEDVKYPSSECRLRTSSQDNLDQRSGSDNVFVNSPQDDSLLSDDSHSPRTHLSIANMKLPRDDLVIIEKQDMFSTSGDGHAAEDVTVSSQCTRLSIDELPKPNTVSSFRDLFESGIIKNRDEESRLKTKSSLDVSPGYKYRIRQDSLTFSDSSNENNSPKHQNEVEGPQPEILDVSIDSSDLDDTSKDGIVPKHSDKNELYDTVRSQLRHVRISSEVDEIRYSWRTEDSADATDDKSAGDAITNGNSHKDSLVDVENGCEINEPNCQSREFHSNIDNDHMPHPFPRKSKITNNNVVSENKDDDCIEVTNVNAVLDDGSVVTTNSSSAALILSDDESMGHQIVTKVDVHNTHMNQVDTDVTEVDLDDVIRDDHMAPAASTVTVYKQPLQRLSKSKDFNSTVPKYSPPKVTDVTDSASRNGVLMANVVAKTASSTSQPNRFLNDELAKDSGFIDAGKSMFFEAGQFQANREPRKVPRKRKTRPKQSAGITVINLTNEMIIQGPSGDIPVTNIDEGSCDPAVPPLDLSNITDDSEDDEYQEGYIPTEIKPCPFQFIGAGIVSGKSSLGKRSGAKFKIQFDDTATVTYEYPSEEWMREEAGVDADDEEKGTNVTPSFLGSLSLGGFDNFGESSDDGPIPYIDDEDDEDDDASRRDQTNAIVSSLPSASGGLSSYKSRFIEDYEFGQVFQHQAEREQELETMREMEEAMTPSPDELHLREADDADRSTFSDTTAAADILF